MADNDKPLINWDQALVEQSGGWAGGAGDWIWAFGKSAVQSIPELVGITPGEDTLRWRNANPVSGLASELAGMAVPYGGWLRAARGIKALEGVAAGLEASKLEKPFTALGGAEIVRLAPFELGRTALSQVVGDQSLGEVAFGAGLNLALGGGIAGGLGVLSGLGKAARPLRELAPEIGEASPQLLLRKIDELAPQAGDRAGDLISHASRLDEIARGELTGQGVRYLDPTITGKRDRLEGLFRPGEDHLGIVTKQRPVTGTTVDTFKTSDQWQKMVTEAGLDPATLSRTTQYPRIVTFNPARELEEIALGFKEGELSRTTKRAGFVEKNITKQLDPVGDGWWMKREPDEGMFVMAKKFRGQENSPSVDDAWILFKTDKPGEFAKNSQQFNNVLVGREKWIVGADSIEKNLAPGELFTAVHDLQKTFPYENFADAAAAAGGPGRVGKLADRLAPGAVRGNQATQIAMNFVREHLAPPDRQFTKSPRGLYAYRIGKAISEAAESFYQKILQGEHTFSAPRALFTKVVPMAGTEGKRSIQAVLEDLDKEKLWPEFLQLLRSGTDARGATERAAQGKVQPRTAALATELEDLARLEHAQFNRFESAAGKSLTPFREGGYGLTPVWEGDHFHVVREEGGKIAGMAASRTPKGAEDKAKKLAAQLEAESGVKYRVAEKFQKNSAGGVPRDVLPFITNPGTTLARNNIRGFKWDLETPTLRELLADYQAALSRKARSMGANGREALLGRHVAALAVEDPHAARMLNTRFNMLAGIEGEFSKAQNRVADAVLAPMLGANSATKIVQVSNEVMSHLQLGAFKLSHPIQNVIGTVQMIAPELAMVMNAPADHLIHRYGITVPAVGSRGAVGALTTLSPVKIMGQAVKAAYAPTKEHQAVLNRALNERVLDARIAEDLIGQHRRELKDWKGAIKSGGDMVEYLKALSFALPSMSEKFARVTSFNAGYIVGRDVLKLEGESLYQFTKKFTERTNFLYASSDRPLVFTSPLGSSMGLFKNWMMNYMGLMLEYGNLGVNKGVWSPLVWQTLGTAAVGGAAATPLYWAAEGASRLFGQKHLIQYAYDEWKDQADGIMFGLPAALTGVSLSSIMTSPGANPVKDASQLFSFAVWSRMKEMGGVVGAAMDNWQATGKHPASDPDVRNGLIKALAPVLLQRAMSVDEEGTVRNIATDLPTAKGLSWYDRLMYRAGLQPVQLEKQVAATEALYHDKQKMTAQTKAFGDALAEAFKSGDSRAADIVLQRVLAVGGPDVGSVLKSAMSKVGMAEKTSAERMARPAALAGWENVLR